MRKSVLTCAVIALVLIINPNTLRADDFKLEEGYKLFFNGKDLTGWKMKGGASLAGKTETAKKRFQVLDGRLVIDYKMKGNMVIESEVMFKGDVHIKFDFKADEKCNNDLYFRGLKFDIKKGGVKNLKPGEWQLFEIVVTGNKVEFKCDGEVQRTQNAKNDSSSLGIRAEFGAIDYRHLRYK